MNHITQEYGEPTNLLEMRTEDFDSLRGFLRAAGVDIRMVKEYAGTCTIQAQIHGKNGYWND